MNKSKALQRRLYSLLSDRTTFLTFIVTCGMITLAIIHLGESWLEWSSDKYQALADNSFSDNLVSRSLRSRLCQYIPIDVVYTWVNGSDPNFLDDLKHAKEGKLSESGLDTAKPLVGCPFGTCVPSHMITLDRLVPSITRLALVKEQNSHLQQVMALHNPNLVCGSHVENRTMLVFDSAKQAKSALNQTSTFALGISSFDMTLTYWSTEWTIPNSFPMPSYFMLLDLPYASTKEKITGALPDSIADTITKIWLHNYGRTAVINSDNATAVKLFLETNPKIRFSSGMEVKTSPANLIIALPKYLDDESAQSNRFADYDQLRYSIRSLEKFAPWVRKVHLVTNGQIPYWINLDHPKLNLITHEEIFEDPNSLPTFSSPAIEANLHRIPGLSEKFLYFNDDVMLGQEVWPEDFFTEHEGFKIRFSWPIPDCHENCPASWINDGYCDLSCNNTECLFDGGDCEGPNVRMGFGNQNEDHAFHWDDQYDVPACDEGCLDNWLADKYCDEACNTPECAFDAGDCGVEKYRLLYEVTASGKIFHWPDSYTLPNGTTLAFWNLTEAFQEFDEVGLVPISHKAVRSLSLSDEHKVMVLMLHQNVTDATINVTIQAKNNHSIIIHDFSVFCNTVGHVTIVDTLSDDQDKIDLPKELELARQKNLANMSLEVREDMFNLTAEDKGFLAVLKEQLDNEELTQKGFMVKRLHLLSKYIIDDLNNGKNVSRFNNILETFKTRTHKSIENDYQVQEPVRVGQRRLLDAYGDSLVHVNRILSDNYGHAARSVPAHIPHFIDINVLAQLRSKFANEWSETAKHKFRQSDDMQFSFSYFHFIKNEKRDFDIFEVFDEFDTDSSETWSDREIRTLLARMDSLPIYLEAINDFEAKIIKCSKSLPASLSNVPAPPFERYYESKLPTVSRQLIAQCPEIVEQLQSKFKDRRKFKHVILDDNKDFTLKRLTSNLSDVVRELDDLRKTPVKFVCLNDDTDQTRVADNERVHAFLIDFFESILPVPSSFELPRNYRNKFLHMDEFRGWDFYRQLLKWLSILSVIALIVVGLGSYFEVDIWEKVFSIFTPRWRAATGKKKNYTV